MYVQKIVMLVIGSLAIAGCTRQSANSQNYAPERPSALPAEAKFVGGVDGGDWVSCHGTDDRRIVCTIYDPQSGDSRYERSMRICPNLYSAHDVSAALVFLDAEGAKFNGIAAFVDRPVRYIPASNDSEEKISRENEISEKYFTEFGVTPNCERIQK